MNAEFFETVRKFKFTSRQHRISDDDSIDRVNSFYTPVIIIILSSIIGAKMYVVGDPIQCWIPPEFKDGWEQFAENYCWVKNTYFVKEEHEIPDTKEKREAQELTYYQWVPFLLALQALMFYIPGTIWKLLNWQSGVHLKSLVNMAINAINGDPTKRDDEVKCLARHVNYALEVPKSSKPGSLVKVKRFFQQVFLCGHNKRGNYLVFVYMIIKCLYVANIVGQFLILNSFLRTNYSWYGIGVFRDLWNGHDWQHSGHFPRVTLCDFNIRVLGNMHPRTLQCVLVINLFNEKVYVFLWFWFFFVAVLTTLNALVWIIWSIIPVRRYNDIKRFMKNITNDDKDKSTERFKQMLDTFITKHLYSDGAFILRLISKNAGDPIVQELVGELWKSYKTKQDEKDAIENEKKKRIETPVRLSDITSGINSSADKLQGSLV